MMKKYDFFFFLNLFLVRKKWILLTAVIFMAATFCICKYCIKPVYVAKATIFCGRIMSNSTPTGDLKMGQIASENAMSLNVGLQLINDYRELLMSERVKDKVLEKDAVKQLVPGTKFYSKVVAKSEKQTRILSIKVYTHSPELSQIMTNAYAEVFLDEVQKIMQMQNAQLIDAAKLPKMPDSPQCMRSAILAFVFGGVLSYLFFFVWSLLDTTIKTTEEAEDLLKLPIVGTIPQDGELDKKNYHGSYIRSTTDGVQSSAMAERFRAARVNLQYSLIKKNQALVYVVTSTMPGEGKSFNASNLAASMAESGKKVLLIGCDLRMPSLKKVFKSNSGVGLVNLLVGEKTFDEVVQHSVMNLPLDVLFSGPVPPNPSQLLCSEEFETLIREQRQNYDYIFLDSPPVMSAADAVQIGRCADAMLLIVRAGYCRSNLVMQTVSELKQAKLNVVGMILNRYRNGNSRHGYGYGYGYGYGKNGDSDTVSKQPKNKA